MLFLNDCFVFVGTGRGGQCENHSRKGRAIHSSLMTCLIFVFGRDDGAGGGGQEWGVLLPGEVAAVDVFLQ